MISGETRQDVHSSAKTWHNIINILKIISNMANWRGIGTDGINIQQFGWHITTQQQ